MLIQVSERILHCIRDEDTASRLGGDEFAILIGDIHSVDECRDVLSRIHHKICEPFHIEGHELTVTASSGITMYPDDQVDIDTLLRHADQAMYRVKLGGKQKTASTYSIRLTTSTSLKPITSADMLKSLCVSSSSSCTTNPKSI